MVGLMVIFIAKVIEVSLTTLRLVFVSKGERLYASSIGLVEIFIWLQVASVVLNDINEHPSKMVMYGLGFAVGNYIGLIIEEWIGLGYSNIEIIASQQNGKDISMKLRDLGYAVTTLNGQGRDDNKLIMTIYVKRKNQNKVLKHIKQTNLDCVITITETQKTYGGFGLK